MNNKANKTQGMNEASQKKRADTIMRVMEALRGRVEELTKSGIS